MQTGGSDCEYDEEEQDCDEDGCHNGYIDDEMSEEEKENDGQQQQFDYQDDGDSANECDECTKPNRDSSIDPLSMRRSRSCSEAITKASNSRMTKSELEWDDQI